MKVRVIVPITFIVEVNTNDPIYAERAVRANWVTFYRPLAHQQAVQTAEPTSVEVLK